MAKNKSSNHASAGRQDRDTDGSQPQAGACPACGTASVGGALFCHHCGLALRGAAGGISEGMSGGPGWPLYIAIGVFALAVTVGGGWLVFVPSGDVTGPSTAPTVRAPAPAPPSRAENPPDLSTMSPREAADRLFNRVMAADERGDKAAVERFSPMALQAYGLVNNLDKDGQYHVGLIHLGRGEFDQAMAQVQKIKRKAPDHLLAITLEHTVALRTGNSAAAARAVAAFKNAYPSEAKIRRPEYTAHQNTITTFDTKFASPPAGSN